MLKFTTLFANVLSMCMHTTNIMLVKYYVLPTVFSIAASCTLYVASFWTRLGTLCTDVNFVAVCFLQKYGCLFTFLVVVYITFAFFNT